MNRNGKLHALLATARVANIPSVLGNVWLGVVVGMLQLGMEKIPWREAAWLGLAGVLLYVAGNFFNDWMDRAWDATRRPERALPRGLFPAGLYAGLALGMGATGIAVAAWTSAASGWVAGAIAFWILIYTVCHKRTAWAVIPMGLCRALLPVMGYMLLIPYVDGIWPASGGIFCYIMGLSLSARYESLAEPPRRVGVMARSLLLGTAVFMAWACHGIFISRWLVVAGAVPYLAWTSVCLRYRRKPVPLLVASLLAGIPLVDWMVLLPVALTLTGRGGAESLMITCFIVPPLAYVAALLLQRVAPAT